MSAKAAGAGRGAGGGAGGQPPRGAKERGPQERGRSHEEKGGEDGGEAGRRLRLAEEVEGGAREPVVERRLLEPGLALGRGGDPLARPMHLDRDPGVARLGRPPGGDRSGGGGGG